MKYEIENKVGEKDCKVEWERDSKLKRLKVKMNLDGYVFEGYVYWKGVKK